MIKVTVIVALVACVFADEKAAYHAEEPKQAPGHNAKVVYHELGQKQMYVNKAAEQYGAGTGTAYYDGVPGTGVRGHGYGHGYGHGDKYGHDRHGYNHRGYGYDGYGYNKGYDGYGYDMGYDGKHHQRAYNNYGGYDNYGHGYGYGDKH